MSSENGQNLNTSSTNRGALWPGVTYFGFVFAVGFVLESIRVLIVVPVIGERASELLETPLMLLTIFFAARWVVRRFRIPAGARNRIPVCLVALSILLVTEILVVLMVAGVSLEEHIVRRDPLNGVIYLASLAVFALMPWLLQTVPPKAKCAAA